MAVSRILHRAAAIISMACLVSGVLLGGVQHANARGQVSDVHLTSVTEGRAIRLVVDEPVDFRLFTLSAPLRLVLDLPAVDWRPPPAQLVRVARQGQIFEDVRHGEFSGGTQRIVFDLASPLKVVQAGLVPHGSKFALIIRWLPSDVYWPQRFGDFREVPIPRARPNPAKPIEKPLIVLDPGHGGVDPGAIGRRGTREKNVTLAMAKRLEKALLATDRFRVGMTRTDDQFLPLRQRTRIARQLGGSLFVSLHADSAPEANARGLSVYTLSDKASDREAEALAKQENQVDSLGGVSLANERPEVVSILIDLAQRETKNRSVRFANQLVQTLILRVALLERPHREAGFAVLKSPDIPAVLVELGFLSNPAEERLLQSDQYGNAIVDGIVAAIENYFGTDVLIAHRGMR
jgi:N-acetylmuramoyl-L-alanine amidase